LRIILTHQPLFSISFCSFLLERLNLFGLPADALENRRGSGRERRRRKPARGGNYFADLFSDNLLKNISNVEFNLSMGLPPASVQG
jgi:hypothetical protein